MKKLILILALLLTLPSCTIYIGSPSPATEPPTSAATDPESLWQKEYEEVHARYKSEYDTLVKIYSPLYADLDDRISRHIAKKDSLQAAFDKAQAKWMAVQSYSNEAAMDKAFADLQNYQKTLDSLSAELDDLDSRYEDAFLDIQGRFSASVILLNLKYGVKHSAPNLEEE